MLSIAEPVIQVFLNGWIDVTDNCVVLGDWLKVKLPGLSGFSGPRGWRYQCRKCKGTGFRDNRNPRVTNQKCRECDGKGGYGHDLPGAVGSITRVRAKGVSQYRRAFNR